MSRARAEPKCHTEGGEGLWEVERIHDERKRKDHPREFLVQWKGCPQSGSSWEPAPLPFAKQAMETYQEERRQRRHRAPVRAAPALACAAAPSNPFRPAQVKARANGTAAAKKSGKQAARQKEARQDEIRKRRAMPKKGPAGHRMCEDCGGKQPSFGLPTDRKKRWCGRCGKKHGAIDVVSKKCEDCGDKYAISGLASDRKKRWCFLCSLEYADHKLLCVSEEREAQLWPLDHPVTGCAALRAGCRGTFWDRNSRQYRAVIRIDGRQEHLGSFGNNEAAASEAHEAARAQREALYAGRRAEQRSGAAPVTSGTASEWKGCSREWRQAKAAEKAAKKAAKAAQKQAKAARKPRRRGQR